MSPNKYHESKAIQSVKVYTMSPSLCHESRYILLGKGYLKVQGWQRVPKGPRLVNDNLLSKDDKGYLQVVVGKGYLQVVVGKGYRKVQGWKRVTSGQWLEKGS